MGSLQPDSVLSASVSSSSPGSPPVANPTPDEIDAVIQMATSGRPSPLGPPKDTRTQLFVGNLPYRVRWQDLKDLFRKAGTVLRADVSLGPDNRSRGYGTVLLASAEDAGRAIDMFNGYSWQTRILEVRLDRLPPDLDNIGNVVTSPHSVHSNPLSSAGTPTGALGVGGFHPNVVGVPSPLGNIYGASPSPQPLGPSMLSVAGLAEEFGSLYSSADRPTSSGGASRSLFVGNLPFHCQWQDLKDLFRQAGTILRADVALGPDGRSRGFGTVSFANEIDAERAVAMFNGFEYNGRALKVHYDRYSQSAQSAQPLTAPTSPNPPAVSPFSHQPASYHSTSSPFGNQPGHLPMPPLGYQFEFITNSGPSSPFGPPPSAYSGILSQPSGGGMGQAGMEESSTMGSIGELSMRANPPTPPSQSQPSARSNGLSPDMSASSPPKGRASQSPTSSSGHHHHHHPGPIALPPPPPVSSFPIPQPHAASPMHIPHHHMSPMHHPMSPMHHPPHMPTMTPQGLPPITPSMPSFNFAYGPAQSPSVHPSAAASNMGGAEQHNSGGENNNNGHTPGHHWHPNGMGTPMLHHIMSPPMFSPGVTMSPGTPAFWGRNSYINPAVGAPVHAYYVPSPQARGEEPASYFPPVPPPQDYFGSVSPWTASESGLRNEVLRDEILKSDSEKERDAAAAAAASGGRHGSDDTVSTTTTGRTTDGTEVDGERESSSTGTSWHAEGEGTSPNESVVTTVGDGDESVIGDATSPLERLRVDDNMGGSGSKLRTMSASGLRRPEPAPLQNQPGGQHRADSDPIAQLHPQTKSDGAAIARAGDGQGTGARGPVKSEEIIRTREARTGEVEGQS